MDWSLLESADKIVSAAIALVAGLAGYLLAHLRTSVHLRRRDQELERFVNLQVLKALTSRLGHNEEIQERNMTEPQTWLQVLALTKALFEAITSGADLLSAYTKYQLDRATRDEALRVSAFSTLSQGEVESTLTLLESCRDNFIKQGIGKARVRCFCSVLEQVRIGSGGTLPDIDDWQRMYDELNCSTIDV